jgi:hypothetical protein
VLEVSGSNHPVPSIVSTPTEDKDMGWMLTQNIVSQRSPGTFHELDLGNAERNRVPVHHTHAGR